MNTQELIEALGNGITKRKLHQWIKQGLPCRQKGTHGPRSFDLASVERWLIDTGKANRTAVVRTQQEVAAHFGRRIETVGKWFHQGCPGTPGAYDLDAIASWRVARNETDPLLKGPTSPYLEKYRREKFLLARLDRRERQGQLIARADVHTGLSIFAGLIRRAASTLQDKYGQDAYDILCDAMFDAESAIAREFGAPTATNKTRLPVDSSSTINSPLTSQPSAQP
jgi:phage terminase Nu1 subunit (DNA packaging protein)